LLLILIDFYLIYLNFTYKSAFHFGELGDCVSQPGISNNVSRSIHYDVSLSSQFNALMHYLSFVIVKPVTCALIDISADTARYLLHGHYDVNGIALKHGNAAVATAGSV